MATTNTPSRPAEISGRWVIAGMFVFGGVLTAAMAIYWHLHTSPFIELQQAIARDFEGSKPRVQGGQHKMQANTPRILRIVMKVDFDPTREVSKARQVQRHVAKLAQKHHDLAAYDTLEIHLYWPEPEKEIKQRTVEIPTAHVIDSQSVNTTPTVPANATACWTRSRVRWPGCYRRFCDRWASTGSWCCRSIGLWRGHWPGWVATVATAKTMNAPSNRVKP